MGLRIDIDIFHLETVDIRFPLSKSYKGKEFCTLDSRAILFTAGAFKESPLKRRRIKRRGRGRDRILREERKRDHQNFQKARKKLDLGPRVRVLNINLRSASKRHKDDFNNLHINIYYN